MRPINQKQNKNDSMVEKKSADHSQYHIVHTYNSHHIKEESWNSLMENFKPSFRPILKTTDPPLKYFFIVKIVLCNNNFVIQST